MRVPHVKGRLPCACRLQDRTAQGVVPSAHAVSLLVLVPERRRVLIELRVRAELALVVVACLKRPGTVYPR